MRNTFIDTIIDACNEREDIFMISGDAGLGVFDEFKEAYPDKFLNLGVAEQNMASFSAGLAMTGYKVFTYNIIPFTLYRCYEQVRNDICYQKMPVVLVGIGSGITYAPQGMTHYSVEDIGLARTLPNLTVFSPADPVEARLAAHYALCSDKPVYVRLAKRGEPHIHGDEEFDITIPRLMEEGDNIALLFHGSVSIEVVQAYSQLVSRGVKPMLVSVPMIQPLNKDVLLEMLKDMKFVVSVEEHYANSGLGSILAGLCSEMQPPWKLITLGLQYGFIHEIKNQQSMREHFGISSSNIVKTVERILEN